LRHEWAEKNPISLVRQGAKREAIPGVLDLAEIAALLTELQQPYKQMVFLVAATGLRVSELLALKWGDMNFDSLEISLNRGVVHQVIGDLKTEASRKPLPLDPDLAQSLLEWQRVAVFNTQHDWVFASPEMRGKQPYWPENILRRHIRPAADRCGIKKPIGWHTFRHSYATHLKANGEDVKVVQESLRHANSRITLDTYTQALYACKERSANESCKNDFARADSNCCGGRSEVNLLTVPFCSYDEKPNLPHVLEKNGGDDETRTCDLCRDSAPSFGNCLKLRGTDGYQNRAWEPPVTTIGP
jgi:integrase